MSDHGVGMFPEGGAEFGGKMASSGGQSARVKVAHVSTLDASLRFLLLNQLQSLQKAGYDVVGVSSPGPDVPTLTAAGISHRPVRMTRSAFTPGQDLRALFQLWLLFRRERFTIVHTHNPKPGLLGQLAAKMAGVPIVVNTIHGFPFHDHTHPAARRFLVGLERLAGRCSDAILSQNREDMATAIREGICPASKIKHLGNGIDLMVFNRERFTPAEVRRRRAELGIPEAARVVGFVGRLAATRKGFRDFLSASRLIAEQHDAIFLIVGDADLGKPDAVEPSVASDYGIAERCRFLGRLPNSELPGLYAAMDVFVLPSLFEGIPRVIMEATAMAVPVVATDVKGNREAVVDGHNGLLVPLGSVKALAAAVCRLLDDPVQAQRLGEEGRALARQRFDERLVFATVRAEYERLLRNKGLSVPTPTVQG